MARDSDGIDITLARPKPGDGASKTDTLPVESPGKYAQPAAGDAELGRGGMGRVLRLEDVHLRREVAVKELLHEHHPAHSVSGPGLANLFVREAQVLARLEHPGVVPIYELGRRADGTPYYAMRKIHGRPLTKALEAAATLDERLTLLPHLVDVAHTVGFAHSRGVVHRDLKPDNVMVGAFGETLVVDWGLALVEGDNDSEGQLAGTPAYMSPEQVNGRRLDARSDVWSIGVMLFELLSGRLPYDAPSVTELLAKVQRDEPPSLSSLEKAVPKPLAAVVMKALARDPADRFSDGEALADALGRAMRARTARGLAVPLMGAVGVVAVLIVLLASQRTVSSLEAQRASDQVRALDAQRARRRQLAESAAMALRADDRLEARRLTTAALSDGPEPLARGVEWMLLAEGVPSQAWRAPVEAGCAHLAVLDGQVLCSTLNGVERFDAATGAALEKLSAGPTAGWLPTVAALGSELVVAGADNRALFTWRPSEPKGPRTDLFPESITTVAPGAGGVLVGLRSGEVFRQPSTGARTAVLRLPGRVRALAADGETVAAANDSFIRVLRAGREQTIDRATVALEFGAGGTLFAGVERSVLRVSPAGDTTLFSGHRDAVTALATGRRLASGDAEGSVRVWRDDGTTDVAFRAFSPGVQALTWSADEALLLVAPRGRSLEAWKLPEPRRQPPDDGVPTAQVALTRGWVLTGLRDGRVRKLDLSTQQTTFLEVRHEGAVRALAEVPGAETPDALRLLTGGDDGQVLAQRWNGAVEVLHPASAARVTSVAVSPDGARAAWALDDGTFVVFALQQGQVVRRAREHVIRALRFSGDSRTLAVGRDDRRVSWVRAEDGLETGQLEGLDAAVLALAWRGPDLVLSLANGHVKLWSAADQRVVRTFTQPSDRVTSLGLNDTGRRLAAGSDDGHVYVWELESGALVADVPADAGEVQLVAFTKDEALIAAGTDRRLHRWAPLR
ncbi:MAG: serine/threonine-protein kinase [Myxococcaceae bacterium]|nr:serine/threonine-protein kinase [Myxococcaceae bacterium]